MPQYFDSGTDPQRCLGNWLDKNLNVDLTSFYLQSGYFGFRGLQPYATALYNLAMAGRPVRFVLGSNSGSLQQADLNQLLPLVQGTSDGKIVVVAYSNAEFHPKTIYIARKDGSEAAVVGSANFTEAGLGLNVEAFVVLDSALGDDIATIREVRDAASHWFGVSVAGVFAVTKPADIQKLVSSKIIDILQPARPAVPGPSSAAKTAGVIGSRRRAWRSGVKPSTPPVPPSSATAVPVPPSSTFSRWCKQLSASDAQQVQSGSNPTGKLRLTKAGWNINHQTDFRNLLFGHLTWLPVTRGGNSYEETEADFNVILNGVSLGIQRLAIDHAPHRIAGQNNVPTVLAWGTALGLQLRTASYRGYWIIIEKKTGGKKKAGRGFDLIIQQNKPSWAP